MRTIVLFFALFTTTTFIYAQDKYVTITMDDLLIALDNASSINKIEKASSSLLNSITKLNVPVTVFVNGKSFLKDGETDKRLAIYKQWIDNPLVTIGNHTYSHLNYANTSLKEYEEDIIRGETIARDLLKNAEKELKYFRFPFNCTGKDSASREDIYNFLNEKGYINTPFTIESMDYMYNALYCDYLEKGNSKEAEKFLEEYVNFTVELFEYFETVSQRLYGRNIHHIYLCHTNRLNEACFEKLIAKLKGIGYSFISLDETLKDKIYQSKDYYTQHFGVSWIYRWIENVDERKTLMRKEPYYKETEELYNNLINQK
jgi:peptidoglycan-N-acetylglucosamine deacetylase